MGGLRRRNQSRPAPDRSPRAEPRPRSARDVASRAAAQFRAASITSTPLPTPRACPTTWRHHRRPACAPQLTGRVAASIPRSPPSAARPTAAHGLPQPRHGHRTAEHPSADPSVTARARGADRTMASGTPTPAGALATGPVMRSRARCRATTSTGHTSHLSVVRATTTTGGNTTPDQGD